MIRKLLLSAVAFAGMATSLMAQGTAGEPFKNCGTDENYRILKAQHPELAALEADLERQMQAGMDGLNPSALAKTTAASDTGYIYDIPVVVHIVHDYGVEYITDNIVFGMVNTWNQYYLRQHGDTNVIHPFDGFEPRRQFSNGTTVDNTTPAWYKAKVNVRFHLATIDPEGNPTKGITRTRSWLAGSASDQAKLDQWNPTNYINVWIIRSMDENHLEAAAYATPPSSAAVDPFSDGIIGISSQAQGDPATIPHELGHILNLAHPWGNNNSAGTINCGDDGVDDTPPTRGHNGTCAANANALYDTNCLRNPDTLGRDVYNSFLPHADTLNYLGIDFKALANLTINNVTIYPTDSVGSPYTITLRKYGFEVASHSGTTTTDSSAMVVPLGFSITPDSGYTLVLTVNPMALRDSSEDANYTTLVPNVIKIGNTQTGGMYNYFYNWNITSGGTTYTVGRTRPVREFSTATNTGITFSTRSRIIIKEVKVYPSGRVGAPFTIVLKNAAGNQIASTSGTIINRFKVQKVQLNWVINTPDTPYRMVFTQNPGMLRELDNLESYPRSVKGAINIIGDSTGGYYNYFHDISLLYGYFKFYGVGDNEYMLDYPDTTNTENIMDYSFCGNRIFTDGQKVRMRTALVSPIGGRSNLWQNQNLITTGIKLDSNTFADRPELKPIADFSVDRGFACANGLATAFMFKNQSWNDTITAIQWTLPADATNPASTSINTFVTGFTTPGWKSVTMKATGNHDGGEDWSTTYTRDSAVYAASPDAVSALGYFQEFNPGSDVDMFPMLNYYNTDHRWKLHNRGFYDNTSVEFQNFDDRNYPQTNLNDPRGIYADLFTRAFDLSDPSFSTNCNLNFMSAGVWRTSVSAEMNDTLRVDYSIDCGKTWINMGKVSGTDLGNNGYYNQPYEPNWMGEWKAKGLNIPVSARKPQVFFRFRYLPGISEEQIQIATTPVDYAPSYRYYQGTGNNFYMDRLSISNSALGVYENMAEVAGVVVAPNPTSGSAVVTIKGGKGTAQVHVMDVAGKLVYTTSAYINGAAGQVEIPASAITVKGIYLVQVTSEGHNETRKLVVY